jgi:hypothetical protein
MSIFFPNTKVDIERPSAEETDEWGDPTESFIPVHYGVLVTVAERRKVVWDPTSSRQATITFHEALVPGHLDITNGDRFVEVSTERILHVTHVRQMQNAVFPGSTQRVELSDPTS